jgi:hypothetical protein
MNWAVPTCFCRRVGGGEETENQAASEHISCSPVHQQSSDSYLKYCRVGFWNFFYGSRRMGNVGLSVSGKIKDNGCKGPAGRRIVASARAEPRMLIPYVAVGVMMSHCTVSMNILHVDRPAD